MESDGRRFNQAWFARQVQSKCEVNVNERWEVDYRTRKWNVTEAQLRAAVEAVGTSAAAVATHLGK